MGEEQVQNPKQEEMLIKQSVTYPVENDTNMSDESC